MSATKGTGKLREMFPSTFIVTTAAADPELSFFDFSYYSTATVKRKKHVYKIIL